MKPPATTAPKWDPWNTFDVSKEKMELALKRKEAAEQRKLEFQRIKQNPHLNTGRGGTIFDPALQRWYSARMTFGRTYNGGRNSPWGLLFGFILPVIGLTALAHYERESRIEPMRRGEVKTREKTFKCHF